MSQFNSSTGFGVIVAVLLSSVSPVAYAKPARSAADDAAAVKAANAAVAEQLRKQQEEQAAAAAKAQADAEAQLSDKDRKKLQKQREKEARELAKKQAREAKLAEEASKPKKPASKTTKAIVGCVGGALVGALLGALLSGKNNRGGAIAGGAAAGCAVGAALGLSQKDQNELNDYVNNDYALREDVADASFDAKESGKVVAITRGETTYENKQQKLLVNPDVQFDPAQITVNERYMRAVSPLRIRGTPDGRADNVVGGFSPNAIIRTFGTTPDGEWTYVVDKDAATGDYTLLGYVSSKFLTTQLSVPQTSRVVVAKLAPVAKGKPAARGKATPQLAKAAPAPAAPRVATFTASTACKSARLAAGGKTDSARSCGGAASIAFNFDFNLKKGWA